MVSLNRVNPSGTMGGARGIHDIGEVPQIGVPLWDGCSNFLVHMLRQICAENLLSQPSLALLELQGRP